MVVIVFGQFQIEIQIWFIMEIKFDIQMNFFKKHINEYEQESVIS